MPLFPSHGRVDDLDPVRARQLERAIAAYRSRRLRDAYFGDNRALFGEPAWDILLELYLTTALGRAAYVKTIAIGSGAPATTAQRYIMTLSKRGLVIREADPDDHRRTLLKLTARCTEILERWLEAADF